MNDGELLSVLGPWGVLLVLGLLGAIVVLRARAEHRHHIDLDVTIRDERKERDDGKRTGPRGSGPV